MSNNLRTRYRLLVFFASLVLVGFALTVAIAQTTTNPNAFITTWVTTEPNQTITIPTNSESFTYNYTVNWGDGDETTGHTGNAEHVYAAANTYTITITGTFPAIYFNGSSHGSSIRTIEQWGNLVWQSMEASFRGVSNLSISADAGSPDLSSVTSTHSMFRDATNFNSPINHWDVSSVSDMGQMFENASAFNQDLSSWDVGSVTNMNRMFIGARVFNQNLGSWDVGKVTDMAAMFNNATLSRQNYDALLAGWGQIEDGESALQSDVDVVFSAGNSQYCDHEARDILIANDWVITDGGLSTNCPLPVGAFGTTWEVNAEQTITIPTSNNFTYDYTVNWGDGSDVGKYIGDATHTYTDADTYTVVITRTFPAIYFSDSTEENRNSIRTIEQWGNTVWQSMEGSFSGAGNLSIRAAAGLPDLSSVTSTRSMFEGATNFNSSIGRWDVSNVTDMSRMFQDASAFNQPLDRPLGDWDVSKVTDMSDMFSGATAFNQDLSMWDVSKVTDMSQMFQSAFAFNRPLDDWDVSKVTDMSGMFSDALQFDQNLGSWDVGQVTDMSDMFNNVTLSRQNYEALLAGWSQIALQSDVAFNAGNSQYCNYLARYILTSNPNNWRITDGGRAANCTPPTSAFVTAWEVPAGQTINITTNSNLTYDYIVDWGDGTEATGGHTGDVSYRYTNAGLYTVAITGDFPAIQLLDSSRANRLLLRTIEQWGDIAWRSMANSFTGSRNLNISPGAGSPDLSSVTNMSSMFRAAEAFNSPIGHWDMSNVTNISRMFTNAPAFNQPLGDWDVGNVTNMSAMFNGTSMFNQNLGSWDVGKVTNMSRMFENVTLSRQNYDALLAGWVQIEHGETLLQRDVPFHAGNSQYCNSAARDSLTNLLGWMITGDQRAANCPPPAPHADQLPVASLLIPPGLNIGTQIRLLFVDGDTDFTNDDISHYNNEVITAAAESNSADIRRFSDQFRALISSDAVHARDNTATTYTTEDPDVPIYWVGGDKVADNYADFYDGSWDSPNARDSSGNLVNTVGLTILTGSSESGAGIPNNRIGNSNSGVRLGRLDRGTGSEINSGVSGDNSFRSLYGLSPVLTLVPLGPQPPVVQNPIPNQIVAAREEFSYTFLENVFSDVNMDELTYHVTAPPWLSIDPSNPRTIHGIVPSAAVSQSPIYVTVVASDGNPITTDASNTFLLTVNPNAPAPPANVRAVAGDGSITVSWDPLVENGGFPVNHYVVSVFRRFDSNLHDCSVSDNPGATSCTIIGLDNGVEYDRIVVTAYTNFATAMSRVSFTAIDDVLIPRSPTDPTPPEDAFVTTWRFDYNIDEPRQITIPTHSGSNYSYTVDWGDGSTDNTTHTGDARHDYPNDPDRLANYVITISGTFPRIYFNNSGDKEKIQSIQQWGNTAWTSMENSFYGCNNLVIGVNAGQPDLSNVMSTKGMFRDATRINQPMNDWDVSSVSNMEGMFNGATAFNQDLSLWDVSNVSNTSSMFNGATVFNQPLGDWVVSGVSDMSDMFNGATAFNQPLGDWVVSAVTDMNDMFNGATAFNQPLGDWVVSAVTDMSGMFNGATAFNQDLSAWDVSAVTDMSDMFNGATAFNQDLGAWDVSAVTDMSNMFFNVKLSLANYDSLLVGWGRIELGEGEMALTPRVMFSAGNSQYCNQEAKDTLENTPNNWMITDLGQSAIDCPPDPSAFVITWMTTMLDQTITIPTNSESFTYSYMVDWGDGGTDNTIYTGNASHTYANADTYTIAITGTFPQIYFNGVGSAQVISTIEQWGNIAWASMENSFRIGVNNLIISPTAGQPDLSLVSNMESMFRGATSFNQPINDWDVSSVTNMNRMFRSARKFNQPLNAWDVSGVTDMGNMFNGAIDFNQDLGAWDVGNVRDMTGMLTGVKLSTANYDSLLAGWSQIVPLQERITFDAGESQYCNQEARDILTNPPNNWIIIDGDLDEICTLQFADDTSIANQVYVVGNAITLVLPFTLGGAAPLTHSLEPLPPGLTILPQTADTAPLLTGIPSVTMPATPVIYTVTAADDSTVTLPFIITVVNSLPLETLTLGTVSNVDLNLKFPVLTADGKIYYYLDADNNGEANDLLDHVDLDNLLNDGNDTSATQEGNHDGSDDQRSVRVGAYTLILPTLTELTTLRTDRGNTYPSNWGNGFYNSATRGSATANQHTLFDLGDGSIRVVNDDIEAYVAFQVLNVNAIPISFEQAEYTIVEGTTGTIILRAEQPPIAEAQIRLIANSETIATDEYSLSPREIVFEPGQSTASFTVSIVDDGNVQSTRQLSLSFMPLNDSAVLGAVPETVINVESGDVPATDDDGLSLSKTRIDIAENEEGSVIVEVRGLTGVPTTVRVTVTGNKLEAIAEKLIFTDSTTQSLTISAMDDEVYEGSTINEITFRLVNTGQEETLEVSITEDDPIITVSPAELTLERFSSSELVIRANTDVEINIADVVGIVESVEQILSLSSGATTRLVLTGIAEESGMIRITARADIDDVEQVTEVPVVVTAPTLEIVSDLDMVSLVAGSSTNLRISVTTTGGHGVTLRTTVDDGSVARVEPEIATGVVTEQVIEVRGENEGNTQITVSAEHPDYPTTRRVIPVEVMDRLRILVSGEETEIVTLMEGESTNVAVTLNRIGDTTVRVNIAATDGITVTDGTNPLSELTFSTADVQSIIVRANSDTVYMGDRSATITLTADGYTTATVIVDIIEDTPQLIGLNVVPLDNLSLLRFTSTEITVSVEVGAELRVETGGAVSLSADGNTSMTTSQLMDEDSTQVTIYAVEQDNGTVRFTVSGDRKAMDTEELNVMVTRPTLEISAVSRRNIMMDTFDMENLEVTVNAVGGQPVTVEADVEGGVVTVVGPSQKMNELVGTGTSTEFTVESLADAGTATITIEASHEHYHPASVKFEVEVRLQDIGLMVDSSPALDPANALNIVLNTDSILTITAMPTTATITVTATGNGTDENRIIDIHASQMETYERNLDMPEVEFDTTGLRVGGPVTLTIEASAAGYDTATETVLVTVLDTLRIEVGDLSFDLDEGTTRQISVGLSRVEGDQVTVNIAAPDGITVRDGTNTDLLSELIFTPANADAQSIIVGANNVDGYIGNRSATIRLEAKDYPTTEVVVTIIEDELPPVGLSVDPSSLEVVVGETVELTIGVSESTDVSITIMSASTDIASVTDPDSSFTLNGATTANSSRTITVSGSTIGMTFLRIRVSADGYATETRDIDVDVLSRFRIIAEPDEFDLGEGLARQTSVSLSLIEGTSAVTVNIAAPDGITVTDGTDAVTVLTFNTTDVQSIIVRATSDTVYMGDRSATITLTADGYTTATVTVTIIDDDIGLTVDPSEDLSLLRFTSTEITVSVEVGAELRVETGGAVSLSADGNTSMTTSQLMDEDSTQVTIYAVEQDNGTVRFTVSGAGKAMDTEELNVMVTRPTLEISAVSRRNIMMDTFDMENLEVTVNAVGGQPVTVEADVEGGVVTVVGPSQKMNELVGTGTSTEFTVESFADAGTATITIEASHEHYHPASVKFEVEVRLQDIGLTVGPSTELDIVFGTTRALSVTVAPTMSTITITVSGNEEGNIDLPTEEIILDGNNQFTREIRGLQVGGPVTLEIRAQADGYATTEVMVVVDVLDTLRIEVGDLSFDLDEGTTRQISVGLSRVEGDQVTVNIAAPDGITVRDGTNTDSLSELIFTPANADAQSIIVGANNVDGYIGNRSATIRLEAKDYPTTEVVVTIIEDELPPVGLSVDPSSLEVVVGETVELTIGVSESTDVSITIMSASTDIASVTDPDSSFTLNGATTANSSRTITVSGSTIGMTFLRIRVSADGYATETRDIDVDVLSRFRIIAEPDEFDLGEGLSRQTSVSLSLIEGTSAVTVNIAAPDGITVTDGTDAVTVLTFNTTDVQSIIVRATSDTVYMGDRSATITLTADGYTTATVIVDIIEDTLQLIGLNVVPLDNLSLVRFTSTEITVSVEAGAELLVETGGAVSLSELGNLSSATSSLMDGGSTQVTIYGVEQDNGTVRFTVSGEDKVTEEVELNVMVTRPTLEISAVSRRNIMMDTFDMENLEVTVNAVGDQNVTLTATVESDVVNLVTVMDSPVTMDVPVNTSTEFTVESLADAGTATITIEASHEHYHPASVKFEVEVRLQDIGLTVDPQPLDIVIGETEALTIEVGASTDISITAMLGNTNIAEAVNSLTAFTLTGGTANNSTTIEVRGGVIGDTTLTVVASAEGYATETETINVLVRSESRIEVSPGRSLTLTEGTETTIGVSLSQIGVGNVTVNIEPMSGTIDGAEGGLSVMPSSITFNSADAPKSVTVTAVNDRVYTEGGPRVVEFRLTAEGYATETVMVTIEEDDRSITLATVGALETTLPRFATRRLTVQVGSSDGSLSNVSLDVATTGSVTLADGINSIDLTDGGTPVDVDIDIFGDTLGPGTVTFTVSSNNDDTLVFDPLVVELTVSKPSLMFSQVSDTINLLVGGVEADLSVTVRAESGDIMEGVTLTATVTDGTARMVNVTPMEATGVPLNDLTLFTVTSGDNVGDATVTIMASHRDYDFASTEVSVNVLEVPRIQAADTLRVTQGESATILVSLSRVDSGNVTVTVTTDGDVTAPQNLTFSNEDPLTLSVRATTITGFVGVRNATVTLTAAGYTTKTVMVTILDDELQPIGLDVGPSDELRLVRFTNAEITVEADQNATLSIGTQGAVRIVGSAPQDLMENTQADIEIYGSNIGTGTVTFTVSQTGYATAVETVMVTVSTPTLVISAVSPSDINLLTSETTELEVTFSAIGGHEVTIAGMVTRGDDNIVRPLKDTVGLANTTTAAFTVGSTNTPGDATIRLTVSHPFYNRMSTDVAVSVSPRTIDLTVDPDELDIVVGMSEVSRITVSASTDVSITAMLYDTGIAAVVNSLTEFTLTAAENSSTIEVMGTTAGENTSLTVVASAEGYATETRTINVRVRSEFSIEVSPSRMLTLTEGTETTIGVSLSQIRDGDSPVTVNIVSIIGTINGSDRGLYVTPTSITFTSDVVKSVTVTAVDDGAYTKGGPREVQFRLEATGYEAETVMVDIEEDERLITLTIDEGTNINLLRFGQTPITVQVSSSDDMEVMLDVAAEGAVTLADGGTSTSLVLSDGQTSTQIEILGDSGDRGTVTFTAVGPKVVSDPLAVSVMVSTPTLVISQVSNNNIMLLTRDTTNVSVVVGAVARAPNDVTLMVTLTGDDVLATVSQPVLANSEFTFEVESGFEAGNATVTLTVDHPDYRSTSTELAVSVSLRQIGLSVSSSALDLVVGASGELIIEVTASTRVATQATLTASVGDSSIISITEPEMPISLTDNQLAGREDIRITVSGAGQGTADLQIRVEADGYEPATETITVRVAGVLNLRFRIKVFLEGAQ